MSPANGLGCIVVHHPKIDIVRRWGVQLVHHCFLLSAGIMGGLGAMSLDAVRVKGRHCCPLMMR